MNTVYQPEWLAMFLFQSDMLMANASFTYESRVACLASLERAMA